MPPDLASENLSFGKTLKAHRMALPRGRPEILQLNVGKLCNLTCSHCHVNAGPGRKEIITGKTVDRILKWLESTDIPVLDLTGGSPEMIPDFRKLIKTVRQFDSPRRVIDRLNATIIEEPGYEWVPEFLAQHEVEIVASMPCYQPDNVEAQRGEGVFEASISAFQKLNALGYGITPDLRLNFVYNPNGAFLPPAQDKLEEDYREAMREHFNIRFHNLYCITNMPIARFAGYLKRENRLTDYMALLKNAFNPATIDSLMCRDTINVNWLGEVFDCDFNQMLKMPTLENGQHLKAWEIDPDTFSNIPIRTGPHCFGCTAGAGSSCGGALA
jgi:radical SAM/Cys-rich protein